MLRRMRMRILVSNLLADLPGPKPWQLLAGHTRLRTKVAGGRRCRMRAWRALSTLPDLF